MLNWLKCPFCVLLVVWGPSLICMSHTEWTLFGIKIQSSSTSTVVLLLLKAQEIWGGDLRLNGCLVDQGWGLVQWDGAHGGVRGAAHGGLVLGIKQLRRAFGGRGQKLIARILKLLTTDRKQPQPLPICPLVMIILLPENPGRQKPWNFNSVPETWRLWPWDLNRVIMFRGSLPLGYQVMLGGQTVGDKSNGLALRLACEWPLLDPERFLLPVAPGWGGWQGRLRSFDQE